VSSRSTATPPWPAARQETRAWQQSVRGGTRADRTLREITVSLPPFIADRDVPLDAALATEVESAVREVVALDTSSAGQILDALGVLLLRTESVASSKIERVEASLEDYARALHGQKTNPSAVSMVAATKALTLMVDDVGRTLRIDLDTIRAAHAALMAEEPSERYYAGRVRAMQNWIGGSDHSPREALYLPPPPETVPAYMDDLLQFANRADLPALVQAAVAHAQFESIHPFTDGNGRIGRALINSILRRRQITTRVVVPVASALVAHRDRYFDLLTAYRDGDLGSLISSFATSTRIAAHESIRTATRLAEIPDEWEELLTPTRRGSASTTLITYLLDRPILTTENAHALLGGSATAAYSAIDRLHAAGILRPLTDRKRDQVWGAAQVLDELDDLSLRIARAAR
jgi:Fic family protein